jgi:hypothetical protein
MHGIPITVSARVNGKINLNIFPQLISIIRKYYLIKYSFLGGTNTKQYGGKA